MTSRVRVPHPRIQAGPNRRYALRHREPNRVPERAVRSEDADSTERRKGALGQRRLAEHELELEFMLNRHAVRVDERD